MPDSSAERVCKRKMAYKNQGSAADAAARSICRTGVLLSAYRCKVCGKWHLTKQRNAKKHAAWKAAMERRHA